MAAILTLLLTNKNKKWWRQWWTLWLSALCKLTYKLPAVGQTSNAKSLTSLSWIWREKLTMGNQVLEGRKLVLVPVFLHYELR